MDHIEEKILSIIDAHADEIKAFGRDIWTHAELGYREERTSKKAAELLKQYGVDVQTGLAVTGFKGYLNNKKGEGPTVAIVGEMDALPINNNKDSNPETGAAHCCGHNAQITGVIGAVMALSDPEVSAALGGNLAIIGAPAEEFVETAYRQGLIDQGIISYGGGKCELIKEGAFSDVDVTVGHHSSNDPVQLQAANGTTNCHINKMVTFNGVSAHAAGSPERGVDAQAAVSLTQYAVDIQRETFRDKDTVRVHSFVSEGANAVNVIADKMTMEFSVRGKNIPALLNANAKVDRAIRAACVATGCGVDNITMPGYMPTVPCPDISVTLEALEDVSQGKYTIEEKTAHGTGTTDFGDVSCIMPLLQFHTGGYGGNMHNPNVCLTDEDLAYVVTAKVFALMAYKLLKNGGEKALKLKAEYQPLMTEAEYVELMDGIRNKEHIDIDQLPVLTN